MTSSPRTSASGPCECCLAQAGTPLASARCRGRSDSRVDFARDHGHRLVGPGGGRAGGRRQVGQWPRGSGDLMSRRGAPRRMNSLQIKEEKVKPDTNGVVKTSTTPEKTDEEEKEDRAAQSLLNKLIRSNLVDTTNQVEVLQRDPNSPLYSVKSFEELRLKPQLLQGVYAMGFNRPSKIQENALPMMLAEPPQNLIAQSQSGTGKTAAFVLAMLSRVEPSDRYPQCLCLSPTYELALQTGKVIEQMGKFHPELRLAYAVRGNKLERGQKIGEQIVIGTPGTVLDWCSKLKFIDPKKIKVFVLDEADVMIATQGHQDQSIRIQRMLPRNCQMLLFSATFEDSVWKFAQKVVPDPNIIKLKREEETLDTIKQYYVLCNNREEKFQALCNLYGAITIAQAMIFCHTRKTASWLAAELSKEGHQVALLSGEMMVEQRAAVIERFREGKEKVLVTTNVCARGIDVEQVSVVINFDLPVDKDGNPDNETYLHRIGRTGRFGKRGLAVNMVDSKHSMNILNRIQEHFNKKIERLDTDDLDEIEKIAN
ncbi:ATP-dependent RNA helicase DDX19A isoform X1 [Nannospalax galili]|uniref:ATP-dependent RNA helicase DDX19A isoform X1 n=1 Tax=Nannospalax galili TaxID=1026970 RepID=UPI000819D6A9|nr:ATP-dependent RNA helicase DDX19A isoform X1 [Nannospalax galili]